MTRGRGSEGETGEWSGLPVLFTLPRNMVYPALLPPMRTPRLSVVDWTDAPADLNGLVRFAERRNLVSARVPSHFQRSLPFYCICLISYNCPIQCTPPPTHPPSHPTHVLLHLFASFRCRYFIWQMLFVTSFRLANSIDISPSSQSPTRTAEYWRSIFYLWFRASCFIVVK